MRKYNFISLIVLILIYGNAESYDDVWTEGINEGAIGSGIDDPWTSGINEGAIGSGIDDPWTEGINEGVIGGSLFD